MKNWQDSEIIQNFLLDVLPMFEAACDQMKNQFEGIRACVREDRVRSDSFMVYIGVCFPRLALEECIGVELVVDFWKRGRLVTFSASVVLDDEKGTIVEGFEGGRDVPLGDLSLEALKLRLPVLIEALVKCAGDLYSYGVSSTSCGNGNGVR